MVKDGNVPLLAFQKSYRFMKLFCVDSAILAKLYNIQNLKVMLAMMTQHIKKKSKGNFFSDFPFYDKTIDCSPSISDITIK